MFRGHELDHVLANYFVVRVAAELFRSPVG